MALPGRPVLGMVVALFTDELGGLKLLHAVLRDSD
jgi:hypothetical protein